MSRGEYAAVQTALVDDPGFQALPPGAKLLWFTLRILLGASGIDVVRALFPTLAELTGMSEKRIGEALEELQRQDWLHVQGNVLWLRNVLKFNPSLNLSNEKHLKGVTKHMASLPKLAIVNAFAEYYGLEQPFPGMGIEWLSDGYSIPDTRTHGHTDAGNGSEAIASGEDADVENSKGGEADDGRTRNVSADASQPSGDVSAGGPKDWNTFAAWMRTEGCALLWKGPEPPAWAHDSKPWTLGRELSVWKQIHDRGEPFDAMVGVIRRTTERTSGKYYREGGRWDRYYRMAEGRRGQKQPGRCHPESHDGRRLTYAAKRTKAHGMCGLCNTEERAMIKAEDEFHLAIRQAWALNPRDELIATGVIDDDGNGVEFGPFEGDAVIAAIVVETVDGEIFEAVEYRSTRAVFSGDWFWQPLRWSIFP